MSYVVPTDAYWNPGPVAYPDEPHEPVPGWGMRPNMTGPRLVGVGGLGAEAGAPGVLVTLYTPELAAFEDKALPYPEDVHSFLKVPSPVSASQLKNWRDTGHEIFDYPGLLKYVSSISEDGDQVTEKMVRHLAFVRVLLSDWANRENAAGSDHAKAAAYAYAQALVYLSFARHQDQYSPLLTSSPAQDAAAAAGRGDWHYGQIQPGRVLSHAATATIKGKPQTSWTASIKAPPPQREAAPPPQEVEQEDQGHMVLWIVIGVVAVGGAAAYALTRK